MIVGRLVASAPEVHDYTALLKVGLWWHPEHAYSGDVEDLAPIVDGALRTQLAQLQRFVETGKPARE